MSVFNTSQFNTASLVFPPNFPLGAICLPINAVADSGGRWQMRTKRVYLRTTKVFFLMPGILLTFYFFFSASNRAQNSPLTPSEIR